MECTYDTHRIIDREVATVITLQDLEAAIFCVIFQEFLTMYSNTVFGLTIHMKTLLNY